MPSKFDKMSGVFLLENKRRKYVYIGQSSGVGVALRLAKSKLNKGKFHNKEAQTDYIKNKDDFNFGKVVLDTSDKKTLDDKANEYMREYLSSGWIIYNDVASFYEEESVAEMIEQLDVETVFIMEQLVKGMFYDEISDKDYNKLLEIAKGI